MLPAMSIMFVLFIIEIFLRDILTEKDNGTLLRIMFSSITSSQYIISKIASGCIMGTLVLLIIILIGMTIFGIIWGNFLYLLLFIIVVSFWISAFFAMLNSFFKNKNQAGAIASPVILIFAAVGGSMIPYNMLPKSIHTVSLISINFWFIKGIENINKGEFPAIHFIVLIISGLVLFALSLQLLKKRITS
jgi:ABC-2 type transport system permease protein